MKNDLLPCPFCGGNVESREAIGGISSVMCSRCYALILLQGDEESTITKWNTRPEPEPRALTLEELQEYIHKPVFIVSIHPLNCRSCWDIISHIDAEILYPRGTDYCYRLDKYGEAWVAYDRELKEE